MASLPNLLNTIKDLVCCCCIQMAYVVYSSMQTEGFLLASQSPPCASGDTLIRWLSRSRGQPATLCMVLHNEDMLGEILLRLRNATRLIHTALICG
jgi:hypothetical protein